MINAFRTRLSGPEDLLEPRAEDEHEPFDYDADPTDVSDEWEYQE